MTQPEPAPERTPRWADRETAAKYLGVHEMTIYRLAKAGTIHRYGFGRAGRYDLNELDDALRATAQPTSGGGE